MRTSLHHLDVMWSRVCVLAVGDWVDETIQIFIIFAQQIRFDELHHAVIYGQREPSWDQMFKTKGNRSSSTYIRLSYFGVGFRWEQYGAGFGSDWQPCWAKSWHFSANGLRRKWPNRLQDRQGHSERFLVVAFEFLLCHLINSGTCRTQESLLRPPRATPWSYLPGRCSAYTWKEKRRARWSSSVRWNESLVCECLLRNLVDADILFGFAMPQPDLEFVYPIENGADRTNDQHTLDTGFIGIGQKGVN